MRAREPGARTPRLFPDRLPSRGLALVVKRRCLLASVALERRSQENPWAVCGEWVGLMTRGSAHQDDASAAHSPPPFPTALTLDSTLPVEFHLYSWIGIQTS